MLHTDSTDIDAAGIDAMVNFSGIPLQLETIVDFLKQEVALKEVCQGILRRQIVEQAAQERNIVVTPEEIQTEANQQRYQKHLESAAATFAWLSDQMITSEDWEVGIQHHLLSQKLAERLFGSEVERYFAEHRLDFEQVSLYRIVVPYQQLAQELFYQIEEREISFYEAAHLYDIDENRRLQCGYEGKLHRWNFNPEMVAIIFGAPIEQVMGPFPNEQGYELLVVEAFISPELTTEMRQEIINRMFQEWLTHELEYRMYHQPEH